MPSIFPAQPIFYGGKSPEGSRYLNVTVNFSPNTSTPVYAYFSGAIDAGSAGMSTIQAGRIDNSNNFYDIYITFQDTNDTIRIPAYSITTFPIYTGNLYLQYSMYTDSEFGSGSPAYNPVSFRVYNFALDNYASVFTYGRTGTGINPQANVNSLSPGLTTPYIQTTVIAVPANATTLVMPGLRTRYKYSISSVTTGTYQWYILSELFNAPGSYTLLAAYVGSQNPWVEQQALPDQPITKTAIYVRSSTAISIVACQWTTSGYDTQQN